MMMMMMMMMMMIWLFRGDQKAETESEIKTA
jgi:hypothetical protein